MPADQPPADLAAEVERLRAENAELRQKIDGQAGELAVLRHLQAGGKIHTAADDAKPQRWSFNALTTGRA